MKQENTTKPSIMNAIIIDDNPTAIDSLAERLRDLPDINIVATASNGAEGLESIIHHRPDILFLDILLPDTSGIKLLTTLNDMHDIPYVVIYTAHNDYILPAFRNNACDCLLKPIDDEEFKVVISRIREYAAKGDRCRTSQTSRCDKLIFYTNTEDFRIVPISEICIFRYSPEHRSWLAVSASCGRPMPLKRSVSKDSILGTDDRFVQVSKRHIININYLMAVKDGLCIFYPPFDTIDDVKVGRLYRRQLINRCCSL